MLRLLRPPRASTSGTLPLVSLFAAVFPSPPRSTQLPQLYPKDTQRQQQQQQLLRLSLLFSISCGCLLGCCWRGAVWEDSDACASWRPLHQQQRGLGQLGKGLASEDWSLLDSDLPRVRVHWKLSTAAPLGEPRVRRRRDVIKQVKSTVNSTGLVRRGKQRRCRSETRRLKQQRSTSPHRRNVMEAWFT